MRPLGSANEYSVRACQVERSFGVEVEAVCKAGSFGQVWGGLGVYIC